jgi:hypothetical protein
LTVWIFDIGIGKTSLSGKVLQDGRAIQIFGTRRYFIACDGATSKDGLMTAIATAVGIQGDDLEKKITKAFLKIKRSTLLVLDNFESPWEPVASRVDVESFLANLVTGNPDISLIITMRGMERPAKILWTQPCLPPLEPFDLESARQTFLALSDCPADDPHLDILLKGVDCVPLAVTLMGTLAQTDTTDILVSRWKSEHSSLLQQLPDRQGSVDISIQISLNSLRMKACPEALELLVLLSLLPDGIENKMLSAMFPEFQNAQKALATLWQTALAYHSGKGRTRILSPIRSHMIQNYTPNSSHLLSLMAYYMGLAGIAVNLGGRHGPSIVNRLTQDIGNTHSVLNIALAPNSSRDTNFLRGAIRAAIDLSKFNRYSSLGNTETLEHALLMAKSMGDELLEADVTFHLAWASKSMGTAPIDGVERMNRQALHIYKQHDYIRGQAGARNGQR